MSALHTQITIEASDDDAVSCWQADGMEAYDPAVEAKIKAERFQLKKWAYFGMPTNHQDLILAAVRRAHTKNNDRDEAARIVVAAIKHSRISWLTFQYSVIGLRPTVERLLTNIEVTQQAKKRLIRRIAESS